MYIHKINGHVLKTVIEWWEKMVIHDDQWWWFQGKLRVCELESGHRNSGFSLEKVSLSKKQCKKSREDSHGSHESLVVYSSMIPSGI